MFTLFYSESQRNNECCPQVLVDDKWVNYTEWTESGVSNWDDAIVVYSSNKEPEIRPNFCGACFRCEYL